MQNDEQEIRELVATWFSATRAGDIDKVLSLMADDVIFLVCGKPPMRGKAAFAEGLSALKDVTIDASSEIEEIKIIGDWAYMWTHLTVTMTPKKRGTSQKRAGNTMSILNKQNGAWCLVRDANMLAEVS
jgi:uncharacterized protein (TIGR02246 family)